MRWPYDPDRARPTLRDLVSRRVRVPRYRPLRDPIAMTLDALFSAGRIGSLALRNRIVDGADGLEPVRARRHAGRPHARLLRGARARRRGARDRRGRGDRVAARRGEPEPARRLRRPLPARPRAARRTHPRARREGGARSSSTPGASRRATSSAGRPLLGAFGSAADGGRPVPRPRARRRARRDRGLLPARREAALPGDGRGRHRVGASSASRTRPSARSAPASTASSCTPATATCSRRSSRRTTTGAATQYGGPLAESRAAPAGDRSPRCARRVGAGFPIWCRHGRRRARRARRHQRSRTRSARRELAEAAGLDAVHVSAYADPGIGRRLHRRAARPRAGWLPRRSPRA